MRSKIIATLVTLFLVLTGCASGETNEAGEQENQKATNGNAQPEGNDTSAEGSLDSDSDTNSAEEDSVEINFLLEKCQNLSLESNEPWQAAYSPIVEDMCAIESVDEGAVDFVFGPSISMDNVNVKQYMETAFFAYTYWQQFIPDDYPKWTWVIASAEDDHQWWEDNHQNYIKPEYKSELDSCPYYSENRFCSSKYSPDEDKSNIPGLVALWAMDPTAPQLRNDTVLDPGHNGPHWYQDAFGYNHWYELLIEGHATMYEIATHLLAGDDGRQREDFAWLAYSVDEYKMTATTSAEFESYYDSCWGQGYKCKHFYYGGGAMFHEKLILDFGYENYMEWHVKLRKIQSNSGFYQLFQDHFGITVDEFSYGPFAEYAVEQFNAYRAQDNWK